MRMKPETIARRARERAESQKARRAELARRLVEKTREHGPDSIWADMLRDGIEADG